MAKYALVQTAGELAAFLNSLPASTSIDEDFQVVRRLRVVTLRTGSGDVVDEVCITFGGPDDEDDNECVDDDEGDDGDAESGRAGEPVIFWGSPSGRKFY